MEGCAYGIPLEDEEILPNMTDEQWDDASVIWDDKALEEQGFEIIHHGNSASGYTNNFITLPNTTTHIYAFDAKRITPETVAQPENAEKFRETATKLGLDPDLAGWYLLVDYG